MNFREYIKNQMNEDWSEVGEIIGRKIDKDSFGTDPKFQRIKDLVLKKNRKLKETDFDLNVARRSGESSRYDKEGKENVSCLITVRNKNIKLDDIEKYVQEVADEDKEYSCFLIVMYV